MEHYFYYLVEDVVKEMQIYQRSGVLFLLKKFIHGFLEILFFLYLSFIIISQALFDFVPDVNMYSRHLEKQIHRIEYGEEIDEDWADGEEMHQKIRKRL